MVLRAGPPPSPLRNTHLPTVTGMRHQILMREREQEQEQERERERDRMIQTTRNRGLVDYRLSV